MDGWALMVGVTTLALIFFGEHFKAGAYLWAAFLFAIIYAMRMGEPMFYMATAGLLAILVFRTFSQREDVREDRDNE